MIRAAFAALAGAALGAATVPADAPPFDPAQAIELADKAPRHEVAGAFRMTVAAVGDGRQVTFLNSKTDYRAPGNVTFSLSRKAIDALVKRSGAGDAQGLIGRELVVAGRLERRAIVNVKADGKALGFNRWGYNVRVREPEQLISIAGR